ncbi:hypothetical protein [Reichenbachiella sp. MALMAid0571]|uniref:hypothetical protein n=1 Tax=Reichenbachiella sp. MALMAid0571 TaxID=3143939 RepID=UPI0032DE9C63
MFEKTKWFIAILLLTFTSGTINAQGCSDAGFCTMGALKPDQGYSKRLSVQIRSIELSQYIGLTHFKDVIFNYTADVNIGIGDKTTIQVKVPYVYVEGVLKNTNGIGDLSLGLAQNLVSNERYQINLTLGTKLPIGNSNLALDGKPLPMYYQTGLGTYDVIAGISLISKGWMVATGYQQSLNRNDNDFWWSDWEGHPMEATVRAYKQSRSLNRGKDIMFRVERNFRFSNFNFNIGLLPIYRLTKDTNISRGGIESKIDGSDGLALTLLVGGGYQFSVKSGIKIMNGFRLVKRHFNPDGLSREFVSNIGYVYKF